MNQTGTPFSVFTFVFLIMLLIPVLAGQAEAPLFTLEDYPRVDGSTSAQPLGALAACRLTQTAFDWRFQFDGTRRLLPTRHPYDPQVSLSLGFDYQPPLTSVPDIHLELMNRIQHSGTHESYLNLISATAELILVARAPSEDELEAARQHGVQIETLPVALDAFVFIVHQKNPVRNLTVDQIRAIYTGDLTQWSEVGGLDAPIHPYQRERNSGSQETMEQLVMKGQPMIEARPLEISLAMMGPFNAIRHDEQGLGYTFRYYDTFMAHMPEITTIAINGISATWDTIQDRTYPFVSEVYLAWLSHLPDNAPAAILRDWFLSDEGQTIVAESGYTPIRDREEKAP